MDLADLQAKLVQRRRGGYCFEHNLLYSAALERLGYEPARLLARGRAGHWVLSARQEDRWEAQYQFTLCRRQHIDFQVANHYVATHPHSPFTRQLIAFTLPDMRRALIGADFTESSPRETTTSRRLAPAEVPDVLARSFGIELTAEETAGLLDRLNH